MNPNPEESAQQAAASAAKAAASEVEAKKAADSAKAAADEAKAAAPTSMLTVDGHWSVWFAVATGVVAVILIFFVVKLGVIAARQVDLADNVIDVRDGQQVFGTFSERFGAIAIVFAFVLGAVLLIVGSWLAGLEVRSRLKTTVTTKKSGADDAQEIIPDELASAPVIDAIGKAAAAIADAFGKLRGTIAVLLAGLLLAIGAIVMASIMLGADEAAAPQPTPSSSVSSDDQGTGGGNTTP